VLLGLREPPDRAQCDGQRQCRLEPRGAGQRGAGQVDREIRIKCGQRVLGRRQQQPGVHQLPVIDRPGRQSQPLPVAARIKLGGQLGVERAGLGGTNLNIR
jgi:hypothetical protein